MSWDAELFCPHCKHETGEWGYTYNTTPMTIAAAEAVGVEWEGFQRTLNGMSAQDGAVRLAAICNEMTMNPAKYDAMNPPNGWGNRSGIVAVMRDMIDAAANAGPDSVWRVT